MSIVSSTPCLSAAPGTAAWLPGTQRMRYLLRQGRCCSQVRPGDEATGRPAEAACCAHWQVYLCQQRPPCCIHACQLWGSATILCSHAYKAHCQCMPPGLALPCPALPCPAAALAPLLHALRFPGDLGSHEVIDGDLVHIYQQARALGEEAEGVGHEDCGLVGGGGPGLYAQLVWKPELAAD